VAGAGDIDGDGRADILVGAPSAGDEGAAYLAFGGSVSGEVDLASLVVPCPAPGEAGWSVAAAGDIDADGRDDLLVGAPWDEDTGSQTGAAFLALGSGF
jgi:hypothetical protein